MCAQLAKQNIVSGIDNGHAIGEPKQDKRLVSSPAAVVWT
jgi:hypothetical protein